MFVVGGSALGPLAIEPKVNNIKIRLSVSASALPRLKNSIRRLDEASGDNFWHGKKRIFKRHHNFIVFRNNFVFIIFFGSGAVNITGIKDFGYITEALQTFCNTFRIKRRHIQDLLVDNVSANGSFAHTVDLSELKRVINERENQENKLISSASFNPSYFPAVFCRSFAVGTILVFNSGKYNIVGAKCHSHIKEIYTEMLSVMSKLLANTKKQ